MRLLKTLLLTAAALMATTSCIRDEIQDCPPLRVKIAVQDKNYFNVDKVELEDRLSETLPFKEYVHSLYWILRDAQTGNVVDEDFIDQIDSEEQILPLEFCDCIPHGKYVLTVWGNLENEDPLGNDPLSLDFHPAGTEGLDIYMTNDTLTYDAWHNDQTVYMERTKGKLIVEKVNLPAQVLASEKTVGGLFSRVSNAFIYSGETRVNKHVDIAPAASVVTKTMLSPSIRNKGSRLSYTFPTGGAEVFVPADVNITMERNMLTVLRYVWDPEIGDFTIYILVNDNWEVVTQMGVE